MNNYSLTTKGQTEDLAEQGDNAGKKFFVNIEGHEYEWDQPTINVTQIRTLGSLPADQPVVCEDEEGRERTLAENEVIAIKPGHRHGRAPKYKRGSACTIGFVKKLNC
jgi:hypothetical protein